MIGRTYSSAMWLYFIPHAVYHLMRWFPKNNRLKIRILLILCVLCVIIPEVYIFVEPRSVRFCSAPLFPMLAAGIAFTMMMIGFSILFALMDPVPYQAKIAFHIFGGITFIYCLTEAVYAFQSQDCATYSQELYWFSLVQAILSALTAAFFVLTIPFWLINICRKNSVLDEEMRMGICYEPVNCCSCIWHV